MLNNYDSDNLLVESLLEGNLEAFDKLFAKYSRKLYGFSLRYLKSEADAEELVQSVFVKVWEKRNSLRKDTSFNSYLFTIAYNDILKWFRSKSYHAAYVKEAMINGSVVDNSVDGIDYRFLLDEIDKVIEKLPPRRRIIFIKSRKQGLSSKQIAEQLNISPGTVDNNISEALKFLREHLKNEGVALGLFFCLFIQ